MRVHAQYWQAILCHQCHACGYMLAADKLTALSNPCLLTLASWSHCDGANLQWSTDWICCPHRIFQPSPDGDCGLYSGSNNSDQLAITVPADMLAAALPSNSDDPGSCGRCCNPLLTCCLTSITFASGHHPQAVKSQFGVNQSAQIRSLGHHISET